MADFFHPFHELREQADRTNQRPTHWWFGIGSREEVLYHIEPRYDILTPADKLFGIPTGFDPDLPRNRVVLKAGKNTVGAFTIPHEKETETDGA